MLTLMFRILARFYNAWLSGMLFTSDFIAIVDDSMQICMVRKNMSEAVMLIVLQFDGEFQRDAICFFLHLWSEKKAYM